MTRSIVLPSNYADWTKSQLIERLQNVERRMDQPDRAESASGDGIEALKNSEARLAEVQRIAQIGFWERDLPARKGRYSDEASRILGYDPNTYEPSYQSFIDRVHPDDVEDVEFRFSDSERNGTPFDIIYRIIWPDGAERTLHSRSQIYRDGSGRPSRIAGTVQDITDRKRAAEQLRDSEERYRTLVDASPEIIYIQCDGKLAFANRPALKLLGMESLEQALGINTLEFVHPDDRDIVLARRLTTVAGKDQDPTELRYLRRDGGVAVVEVVSARIVWHGRPARLVIGRDITGRKQAENTLRESEERFRDMTANVPGIIYQFRIDAAGEPSFPYVSPAIKEILGIEAADTVADPDTWFGIVHPDDRPGLDASIEESHRTLEPWQWEGRLIRASGEPGWFRGSSTPRKQDDGSVLWTGLVLDITSHKMAEVSLRENRERLAQSESIGHLGSFCRDSADADVFWSDEVYRIFGFAPDAFVPTMDRVGDTLGVLVNRIAQPLEFLDVQLCRLIELVAIKETQYVFRIISSGK